MNLITEWEDEKLVTIIELIKKATREAALETIRELNKKGMLKNSNSNSFTRTEKILYLYPKLKGCDQIKKRVDNALISIREDEYFGVIESYFFERLTFEKISDIYDVNYRTISRQRKKLVNIIAKELFPEEVVKEILED